MMNERVVIVDDELDASLSPALQDYNNAMQKLPTQILRGYFGIHAVESHHVENVPTTEALVSHWLRDASEGSQTSINTDLEGLHTLVQEHPRSVYNCNT